MTDTNPRPRTSEIAVTEANDNETIALRLGDALTVRLQESPTTGYRWTLTMSDNSPLETVSDTFTPGSGASVGGGGVRTFRLIAKKQGMTKVQLNLAREWERGATTKTLALNITVD